MRCYRGLQEEVEQEAEELARKELEQEENKQDYLENKEELDSEYKLLQALNTTRRDEMRREYNLDIIRSDGMQATVW